MIDRFASVFIPSLGWFELKPGDAIAESLREVALSVEPENCASGKITFEVQLEEEED